MNFSFLEKYWPVYLTGLKTTLLLSVIVVFLGTILGILLVIIRRSRIKPIKWLGNGYVGFIRGTPLLAQIYLVYIGIPIILYGFDIPDMTAAALALSLNASAYISETIRSGIEAVNIGQTEAARSLGMSAGMTLKDIILPQAFKNILPALGNQFIGITRDTSMVSVIGVAEIMYKTTIVRGNTALGLEPVIIASLMYLAITLILTRILGYFERRLKQSDRR
ncbi:MAG: amino acid ABC transporter permease [Lachnospiraceae bacterium]|nr:amino acid ABC transporter permease [Lachnospiraceae bacterium]